jgi:putative membrane protein
MLHHGFFFPAAPGQGPRLLLLLVLLGIAAAAVTAIVLALRSRDGSGARTPTSPTALPRNEASRILDERYARGEIDDEEYQRRRAVLSSQS